LKATGIVRRIDDLGRVVIPKEIRRTLRIREGDPLEIFTERDGEVILKKYSPIGELSEFASQYADSIHKTSGHITCITDKDGVVAVAGISKKEFANKTISEELERIIKDKATYITKSPDEVPVSIVKDQNGGTGYTAQVIVPIISEGDPIGSVMILSTDPDIRMGELETKLAQSAAGVLGMQMEQ
jgi:AbrB family transcriptional regulator, stage V sporulation protein T